MDFARFIYTTIVSVIATILGVLGTTVGNKWANRKREPINQSQAITDLADTMVRVSTQAVEGIRGELDAAQANLRAARDELDQARIESRAMIGRLSTRVALLERILRENHLEVPPDTTG